MTETPEKLKVFISYSREDLEFAEQLVLALKERGFEPLLDRENIDAAEEWKRRLGELIFSCDTVVFVLSARSAASPICAWEVEQAASLHKRMIPVVPAPVVGVKPPPQLAELNYVFFYSEPTVPGSGFYDGVIKLDRALRVDLAWLREGTRLSEEAAAWIASGRSEDRLLRGAALEEAQGWRVRTPTDTEIAPETLAFLAASADAEIHRKAEAEAQLAERQHALTEREAAVAAEQAAVAEKVKAEQALRDAEITAARDRECAAKRVAARTRIGALAALVLALVAGIAGGYARFQANRAQDALARLLVERSWDVPSGERELAMKYALAGNRLSDGRSHLVRASLARSINVGLPTIQVLKAVAQVRVLAKSRAGAAQITLAEDNSAELWRYSADKQTWERTRVFNDVFAASFSPEGRLAMIVGRDATVRLVHTATGTNYGTVKAHKAPITSAAFSPDGTRLVTASVDGAVRLWEAVTGKLVTALFHDAPVQFVSFSFDRKRLLTASADNTARLWDAATGALLGAPLVHEAEVTLAVFSADPVRILTASRDGTARLWDAATGAPLGAPLVHEAAVIAARFSLDEGRVLTVDNRSNFYIWRSDSSDPERVFLGKRYGIDHGRFSSDGRNLVGVDRSGNIIVWEAASGRVILETNINDQELKLLDATARTASIGLSDGSVHLLDYSAALKSLGDLQMEACRQLEATNNTNFSALEIAADALITDTWIASADGRSFCDFD